MKFFSRATIEKILSKKSFDVHTRGAPELDLKKKEI
jgi:hypothetical protein